MFRRSHIIIQTNNRAKGNFAWSQRNVFKSGIEPITVQLDLFGERFLYESALLVVKNFLIRAPVRAIFRFRCNAEGPIEWNVELREHFTQFRQQVLDRKSVV